MGPRARRALEAKKSPPLLSSRRDYVRHSYDVRRIGKATVDERECMAKRFEDNRKHLRAVAFRMLGSLSDAEDAVQEAWLRLGRSDASNVANLGGWLTTIVARVCLDMLRAPKARREESQVARVPETLAGRATETDPEQESMLADSLVLALLVVLEALTRSSSRPRAKRGMRSSAASAPTR
jgi:DNA-directed RNA polymerase specialized sigma24 family protein